MLYLRMPAANAEIAELLSKEQLNNQYATQCSRLQNLQAGVTYDYCSDLQAFNCHTGKRITACSFLDARTLQICCGFDDDLYSAAPRQFTPTTYSTRPIRV